MLTRDFVKGLNFGPMSQYYTPDKIQLVTSSLINLFKCKNYIIYFNKLLKCLLPFPIFLKVVTVFIV